MKARDKRMKQMAEILTGIKVLKLCAWENPFIARINTIRSLEISLLQAFVKLVVGCIHFTFACSPFFVTVAVFGVYVLVNPTEPLTAEKVCKFDDLLAGTQMYYSLFHLQLTILY